MGHSQGLDLIGEEVVFVCVWMCVYVCACLRPWEGWLCKPKLAPAMPQSLSEMKDDGSTEPRSKGRIFATNSYENKYTPNRRTKAVIYDTATIIGIFFCYKIGPLWLHCKQREMRKQRVRCLSLGRTASNHYWRRWPTVNWLESSRQNSWHGAGCVCSRLCVFSLPHTGRTQ